MDGLNLTPKLLSERWGGVIKVSTLATWRWRGQGPKFIKLGDKTLYPIVEVEAYERANLHSANSVKVEAEP